MKVYGGVKVQLQTFTLALDGGEWSASLHAPRGKCRRYPLDRVDPRAGHETVKILARNNPVILPAP
jgi:hypothetical protein